MLADFSGYTRFLRDVVEADASELGQGQVERTQEAMACPCAACSSVANRDVKFVMHQGTYIAQTIAGNTELLGPDVTTALQMLKNDVTSTTGWRAYALASSTAVDFLQIPRARGRAIRLDYEHVAPMEALVIPLE